MNISSLFKLAAAALLLAGCGESVSRDHPSRILFVGDSMLASHRMSDRAVADAVEQVLREPVVDRSVIGARFFYPLPISGSAGLNITKQYVPGQWDWVVVNGGGNDLWLGCGCVVCDGKLNRLISKDGRKGRIPGFLSDLRRSGAQVVYVGYMRSPGRGSLIEHCRDEGTELERRVEKLAALDNGVHFLSLSDLVPEGDASYHALDMIHPSIKGSNAIGQMVANIIEGP
ncbi:MAG: SGNH/GDSL hydrolase family protein [Roseovarius sp.]|uniref:SGNH/GDSL hydrolase family protein n=1 Tax=Roseovarius sp. TaxID=1486281 RepID=UPI0032EE5275